MFLVFGLFGLFVLFGLLTVNNWFIDLFVVLCGFRYL